MNRTFAPRRRDFRTQREKYLPKAVEFTREKRMAPAVKVTMDFESSHGITKSQLYQTVSA